MPDITPKLRDDLKLTQLDGSSYDLTHPSTGVSLRLDSVGYLVAELFESGTETLASAQKQLKERFGIQLEPRQVLEFLLRADELGFLEKSLDELGFRREDYPALSSVALVGAAEANAEILEIKKRLSSRFAFLYALDRRVWIMLLGAISLFGIPWKLRIGGPILVKPFERSVVRSSVTGTIDEVFVREGQQVKVGGPLCRLSGYRVEIERKHSELARIEAELQRLRRGATPEELQQMNRKVELAAKIAEQAEQKAHRAETLLSDGLISDQDYQNARADFEVKSKSAEEAEAERLLLKKGPRSELVRAKEAERQGLMTDLNLFVRMDQASLIRSTLSGVVATADTPGLVGRQLKPGDLILEIANPETVTIEMLVRERDIAQVQTGSALNFKVQAFAERTFPGSISRIAPVAETKPNSTVDDTRYFRVYADLDNRQYELRSGMSGMGHIDVGWKTIGIMMFHQTIRAFRVEHGI